MDWLFDIGAVDIAGAIAKLVSLVIVSVGLVENLFYIVLLIYAGRALALRPPVAREAILWNRYASQSPSISILAPAYNEELNIVESTNSLLSLQYPDFEVIVINDGSKDGTLQELIDAFDVRPDVRYFAEVVEHKPIRAIYRNPRIPRLVVVDKVNGGKADALNAGINIARSTVFCSIDADSVIERDALIRAVRPFVEDPERTVAVGGTVRIVNGSTVKDGQVVNVKLPTNWLALVQIVEYFRAFLMARLALSRMRTLTIISGAFGLFSRDAVLDVGGYAHNTVGEDMELVVRLHRRMRDLKKPYRIDFIPEPVCWTEVPEDYRVLGRQRARWQRGSIETFIKHRDMLFNPKYGRIGFIGLGQVLFVDILGPPLQVLGYFLVPLLWLGGWLSVDWMLAFLAITFTFGLFISMTSLVLEEAELRRLSSAKDLAVLALVAIGENFGYRQMSNFWRVRGYWQYLRKNEEWGTMTRSGFKKKN